VEKAAALAWIRRPDSCGIDGQNQWNRHFTPVKYDKSFNGRARQAVTYILFFHKVVKNYTFLAYYYILSSSLSHNLSSMPKT